MGTVQVGKGIGNGLDERQGTVAVDQGLGVPLLHADHGERWVCIERCARVPERACADRDGYLEEPRADGEGLAGKGSIAG